MSSSTIQLACLSLGYFYILKKCKYFRIVFGCITLFSVFTVYLLYYLYFRSLKKQIFNDKKNLFHLCLKSKEKTIQNFLKNKEEICTICFEECNTNDICELNCPCQNKFYHLDCIKTWIFKNPSCPICRVQVYQ